jgi:DNA-binding transcriptional LysR family regulator
MLFGAGSSDAGIRLDSGERSVHVAVTPRMLVSDMDVLHGATTAGLGIALLPAYHCLEDLRARRLERVLRDWNAPSTPVHVVYPSSRHVSPKLTSFVDHLYERMTPPPWQLGPIP